MKLFPKSNFIAAHINTSTCDRVTENTGLRVYVAAAAGVTDLATLFKNTTIKRAMDEYQELKKPRSVPAEPAQKKRRK